jgi:hypothetical protein
MEKSSAQSVIYWIQIKTMPKRAIGSLSNGSRPSMRGAKRLRHLLCVNMHDHPE